MSTSSKAIANRLTMNEGDEGSRKGSTISARTRKDSAVAK